MGSFVVFLVAAVLWLNGPGIRYLAPLMAKRYLEDLGFSGSFQVEGTVTGGLSLKNFRLESEEALAALTIDRATPHYNWRDLRKGKLEGLTIEGLHADIRLGLKKEQDEPFDLAKIVHTLRNIQGHAKPLDLTVRDASITGTKDGELVFSIGSSGISHKGGSDIFNVGLGKFTDPTRKVWPAQVSEVEWTQDQLSVDQIDPLPGIGLRDLVVQLPASGDLSFDSDVLVDDAVLEVSTTPGLKTARVDLREGSVQLDQVAGRLGLKLPGTGRATSLALEVEDYFPDPKAATGSVRALLEDVSYRQYDASELNLDVVLGEDQAEVRALGKSLDTDLSINATAPVDRTDGGFVLGDLKGEFAADDVSKVVTGFRERARAKPEPDSEAPAIDPETSDSGTDGTSEPADPGEEVGEAIAEEVEAAVEQVAGPDSSVSGSFEVRMADNKPQDLRATAKLRPRDETAASAVDIDFTWEPEKPLTTRLRAEGLNLSGGYDPATGAYDVNFDLDEFSKARIDRWLALADVRIEGDLDLSGQWTGSGNFKEKVHRGELDLSRSSYRRPNKPEITVSGTLTYDWPGRVVAKNLHLVTQGQSVLLDATLENKMIEVSRFLWSDGEREIAEGTASLPVPEDFSKWRETLAEDPRPVAVSIQSRELSLGLLKPWLPERVEVDPRSTAQVDIKISGSYPNPEVEAVVEARDLRSPTNEKLPPADLRIEFSGRDGRLAVKGTATAPDFPPANLTLEMPFRPAAWAGEPGLLMKEPFDAKVELPRLDISRFATLLPAAKDLTGIVTGNVTATGTFSDPVLRGDLKLQNGGLVLNNDELPSISGVSADFDLNLDRVLINNIRATVAGGSVSGGGSVVLDGGKPGPIDVQLRADHLPVVRNERMIIRANAGLRVQGMWDDALVTGTIGGVDSLFYRDIEILPIGRPFTGPSAAKLPKFDTPRVSMAGVPEPFSKWRLDVVVRTDEPFLIRGNLGTGEMDVAVRLGGTIGNPLPDGSMRIRDVVASLPFSRLTVRTGYLRFTPETGFDPILEIRGQAEPRPYRVNIYVHGQLSDPQLILTSSPPLPDNEIMTLLATGTTTSGLEDPQAASSRAIQLLIEEARRGRLGFARQLRPVLKVLDRVDFNLAEKDPYDSDTFSTATVRLSDRWYVTAGMGSEGDSRVLALWRFSFR